MNYNFIDDLFLVHYPDGLEDERFLEISKRHQSNAKVLDLVSQFDREKLKSNNRNDIDENIQFIIKIVSKSSMISVFEKVTFKNYLSDSKIHDVFLQSLYYVLADLNEDSLNDFVQVLNMRNIELNKRVATWPIVSFFLFFFNDKEEVFIKPTTIKKLATLLEYPLKYQSHVDYQTYLDIREMIISFKRVSNLVDDNSSNIITQAILYCALDI